MCTSFCDAIRSQSIKTIHCNRSSNGMQLRVEYLNVIAEEKEKETINLLSFYLYHYLFIDLSIYLSTHQHGSRCEHHVKALECMGACQINQIESTYLYHRYTKWCNRATINKIYFTFFTYLSPYLSVYWSCYHIANLAILCPSTRRAGFIPEM